MVDVTPAELVSPSLTTQVTVRVIGIGVLIGDALKRLVGLGGTAREREHARCPLSHDPVMRYR